jgi:glycosyltransferase involved in cell wall biosynthesis
MPTIATRVGGVSELIVEGETGFLMPSDDFDALNDRMIHLLQWPTARRRMGEAARRRAVAHHDTSHTCARVVDLLKTVAGQGARAA